MGIYWKELAHVGTFKMADGTPVNITEPILRHWDAQFSVLQGDGYTVPVPIEHTPDVKASRGRVLAVKLAKNSKGQPALFGRIEITDPVADRFIRAKRPDVSVFSSPTMKFGGRTYNWALGHVAITTAPVITGMDPFTPESQSTVGRSLAASVLPVSVQQQQRRAMKAQQARADWQRREGELKKAVQQIKSGRSPKQSAADDVAGRKYGVLPFNPLLLHAAQQRRLAEVTAALQRMGPGRGGNGVNEKARAELLAELDFLKSLGQVVVVTGPDGTGQVTREEFEKMLVLRPGEESAKTQLAAIDAVTRKYGGIGGLADTNPTPVTGKQLVDAATRRNRLLPRGVNQY